MERFKNILFVSLGNKEDAAALDRANRLAVVNGAKITLLRVLEGLPAAASFLMSKEKLNEFQKATRELAQRDLDSLAQKIDPSVKVSTTISVGKPFFEIIRTVQISKHDVLIKAKIPAMTPHALDSTDLHLLRKCPVPIMLLKPGRKKVLKRVMAAIDLDPEKPVTQKLHYQILKLATSLSEREKAELDIFHAWQSFSVSTLQGPRFNLSSEEIMDVANKERSLRKAWLEDALTPFEKSKIKIRTHLLDGDPAEVIPEFTRKRKTDLLVMGSLARGGLQGLLIGNTAERVLDTVNCSTLTIKPDDFICPIKG